MSITKLVTTTVRPAGTQWFNQAEPEKIKELKTWIKSFPGLLHSEGKQVDDLTWQNTFVFESKDACDAFVMQLNNHAVHKARLNYWDTNNQVSSNTITEL